MPEEEPTIRLDQMVDQAFQTIDRTEGEPSIHIVDQSRAPTPEPQEAPSEYEGEGPTIRNAHQSHAVHNKSTDSEAEPPLPPIRIRSQRSVTPGPLFARVPHPLLGTPVLRPITIERVPLRYRARTPEVIEVIEGSQVPIPERPVSVISAVSGVPAPPYEAPEDTLNARQEQVLVELMERAMRPIIPQVQATIHQEIEQVRVQSTDLQNRQVANDTRMERLENLVQQLTGLVTKEAGDHKKLTGLITESHNNSYHAYTAAQTVTKGLDAMEDTLRAIPDLLAQIREQGEGHLNLLKEIKETNEVNQELLMSIDSKKDSEPEDERPPSAASLRTDFLGVPVGNSTRRDTEKGQDNDLPKGARAKKPDAFEGKKRDREAENFLMKMELYFLDYPNAFDHTKKISTTLSNMKEGDATRWSQPLMKKVLVGKHNAPLDSWDNFKKAFLLAFGDPIKKDRAVNEIHKLVQTKSAQDYASQFRILMDDLEWDEKALIDRFKHRLKDHVRKEILRMTFMQDTDDISLEKWIKLAIKTDDVLFATHNKDTRTFQGKAAETKPVAMGDRILPLEMARRRKEGLCLKCGKKNHFVKECRQKGYSWDKKEYGKKAEELKEEAKDDEKSTDSESEN